MTEQRTSVTARMEVEGADGVAIRQLISEDAPHYFNLVDYDREHLSQEHNGERDETADKYQRVEDVLESIDHPQRLNRLRFGIWDGDIMVGSNSLDLLGDGRGKSGSWIGKQYVGHQYAARGRKLLLELAFERLGLSEVISEILPDNTYSLRSVESSGYHYVGDEDGRCVYVITREDFLKQQSGSSKI